MNAIVRTRIGIGLVSRDGRYLIRQRPEGSTAPLAGFWEFPGGKCEPGEDPAAAARRECREELGFEVWLDSVPRRVEVHSYAYGTLELHFFDASPSDPAAEPDADRGFRWVTAAALPSYRFPDANAPVLRELAGAGPD